MTETDSDIVVVEIVVGVLLEVATTGMTTEISVVDNTTPEVCAETVDRTLLTTDSTLSNTSDTLDGGA